MNKKVSSFPILFALLALLVSTCAVVFPASAQAAPTSTGSITVSGTVASSYNAYQIFSANVVDGDNDAKIATDLAWASDAVRDAALPVLHSAGMPQIPDYRAGSCRVAQRRFPPYERAERTARSFPPELWCRVRGP